MISKEYLKKLVSVGYSIIPVDDNKKPIGEWKQYQTNARAITDIDSLHSPKYGLLTGYNGLEVIDVDLKVFDTLQEQTNFWNEYLAFLKDNIDDFDNKFVIYKTINKGYHILYRCSNVKKNSKIAKLKGHAGAVIESRGLGGMVVLYENKISKLAYSEIQTITDMDAECIWSISKSYNYVENIEVEKHQVKEYQDSAITPWTDYNAKVSIFDIVQDEFKIVRNLSNRYEILRNGAKSATSGSIFKNSGCMYLFSTGTNYPAEKLITPFIAYAIKHHNGNYKNAAGQLYKDGYGSRSIPKIKEVEPKEKIIINENDLNFPLDIFPKEIQDFINESEVTLGLVPDYMGCSLLWLISLSIGQSLHIKIKNGYTQPAVIWISLVGKAGIGKTPSINHIINPLKKLNNQEIKNYIEKNKQHKEYEGLTKAEKNNSLEIPKPSKTQFLVDDITLEALVGLHEDNKHSIGVFKDELAGWYMDMNKYREGSDLQFWLSSWGGESYTLNRKMAESSFLDKTFIPILGGIQPAVLNTLYTDEKKDNGFIDRMLLCYPDLHVPKYNRNEISEAKLKWFSDIICGLYSEFKNKIIEYFTDGNVKPKLATMDAKAFDEYVRIYDSYVDIQNGDNENEYMKSMYPKQKNYLPRFALLIHVFNSMFNDDNLELITRDSMIKAEKLSKYFIAHAKKIKINSSSLNEMKTTINSAKNKSTKEKLHALYLTNEVENKSEVAEMLGISRVTINKWLKEFENAN
jgi:transposase-like protein